MRTLTTSTFVIKRLKDDWKLLLSILFGITIATTLIAGAPIYLKTLERQGLNTAIERAADVFLNIVIYSPYVPLNQTGIESSDQALTNAVQQNIQDIYRGQERYLKSPTYLVGTEKLPLSPEAENRVSRGYVQQLTNLEHHVRFIEGRMSADTFEQGPRGPIIEAVIGIETADAFDLRIGATVILAPALGDLTQVTVNVVGIIEPVDPAEEYWQHNANIFLDPEPIREIPDAGVEVDPEEPPIALFVSRETMVEAVGNAYPGTLVSSTWFILVNREQLKEWSAAESTSRINGIQREIASVMQGSVVLTGIKRMIADFEKRSFFSSVPLLLLLVIMIITVLYYLAMMVSYLVQSREDDVALLRSRGVSAFHLLRLYATEGLVLTVIASLVAPFIAFGAIAIAGKLPFFQEITGGDLLPVEFSWTPFAVAAGAGLLSLAIFVIPGVVGARSGLVIHKLRASRPPSVPVFQRYYVDIALLVFGGIVFWELHERGQLITGGLFSDVQVNEALLLAPVLLLTVVALLFMRLFPLFVRFMSGDSPALIHVLTALTLISLGPAIAARQISDTDDLSWVWAIVVLALFAAAYWATQRASMRRSIAYGIAAQALLVALASVLEPPASGEFSFAPSIVFILLVPMQLLFLLLRRLTSSAPVWLSMSVWHMSRNPLQYSWLVLLLVMVTGLGVLATTVGGTLDRSYEERILYEVAADLRVTGISSYFGRGRAALKETYLTIPGVTSVSLALRGSGIVGTTYSGNRFEVLALESQDFPYISWYRDDFSERSLSGVMRALQATARNQPITLPEGATSIGMWVKPEDAYPNVFVWAVVQDRRGVITTVSLGEIGPPEWRLMKADIPRRLQAPVQLVSVQIYEPVFGPAGTPGTIYIDDIHATVGTDTEAIVLDDFEGTANWTPLATSIISSDSIRSTRREPHEGERAGAFAFGKDTDQGIRGFYHSPSGGPVPVVASTSFVRSTGVDVGRSIIVNVMGRLIPIVVTDTVDYFPTMNPEAGGFFLTDLDNLLRHLNILSPTSSIAPNELFIAEAAGAGETVRDIARLLAPSSDLVHDKATLLREIRLDPLITAGWRAMVILALGIIIFTAGLGYITYLLSYAERSRSEMGYLQSLGLSRQQLTWLLSLEHLTIVIVGLGLGTWAGFQMSTVMVSAVAVTEEGRSVIPPFILTTDWTFMAPIYAALIAIFLGSLYRLIRSMSRLDLLAISRVEGE